MQVPTNAHPQTRNSLSAGSAATIGLLALAFCFLFVGDHWFGGLLPSFFIVWLAFVVWFFAFQMPTYKRAIYATSIACIALLPPLARELYVGSWNWYAFGYVQLVLSIPFYYILSKQFFQGHTTPRSNLAILYVLLFILLVLFVSWDFYFGGARRARFIFGPNIMYRIYGVLGIVAYILVSRTQRWNLAGIKLLIGAATVLGCISTGSRGGMVTVAAFLGIVFLMEAERSDAWKRINKAGRYIMFIVAFIIAISGAAALSSAIGSRAVYFDPENSSEAARIGYWMYFLGGEYISGYLDVFLGTGSGNGEFRNYPHNIFMEAFAWGGAWMLMIVLLSSYWIGWSLLFSNGSRRQYAAIAAIILVGAQLSGSFVDNYPAVAMAIAGMAAYGRQQAGNLNR